MVQLSHPYMTTGKTIALTRWTFVGKVMSLLSNMLSRLVLAFLSRRKHLLTLKGDNGTISSWVALLPFTALKPKLQNKILCWQTNAEPNLRNQWIREACLCPHTVLSSSATKHPPVSHRTSLTKHKFKEKAKNFKMVTWDHETSSRRLFWAPGPLCATPWAAAYQASPSMGLSRQEHWSGLPLPSPSLCILYHNFKKRGRGWSPAAHIK